MWTMCTLPKTAAKLARELMLTLFHLLNYAAKSAVPVPPGLLFHHLIPNIQSLLAQQYVPNTIFLYSCIYQNCSFLSRSFLSCCISRRAGIHISRAEKTDFTVCKLNGNIASPKSTLSFHCEVTSFTLKKQESALYNEDVSFRYQGAEERGLNLLFPGKIKTFLNNR